MRHALKALMVGAALVVLGLAPDPVAAQNQGQGQGQGQNQGQVGGVSIDASGSNEVYTSDAGQSGQSTINNRPGASSVNTADGQGNREERRAARRAERAAERAAAGEAAAPVAEEPAAFEPVPEAPAEPVADGAGGAAPAPVVALPNTGTGSTSQAPAALALLLATAAAAGAVVTGRRIRRA